jgi:hypothetical protein
MQNIQLVDFVRLGAPQAPAQRFLFNLIAQRQATLFAEFFGIIQTHNRLRRIEDHRRGHDRANQRPAANLINAEKKAAKEADRKARNHRLILQGVLFDLAGLENRSRGELLGLLLAASTTDDPQRWASWKAKGDALLAEKGDAANG